MLKTQFTLIAKRPLTHDVYELIYSCPTLFGEPPKPGQYVLFQLAPGLSRAYSLSGFTVTGDIVSTFTLIIKRIPEWRWSPIICDAEIGTTFSGMIPLGHFTLRDTPRSKCYIGTGTGFAPLYCQMSASLTGTHTPPKTAFVFGVRNFIDAFYEDEIIELWRHFPDFEYTQYFSRESDFEWRESDHDLCHGYVTEWITPERTSLYWEYYLCGSPAMVQGARDKLEALGVPRGDIYWEQF